MLARTGPACLLATEVRDALVGGSAVAVAPGLRVAGRGGPDRSGSSLA
jgi:hypothetical protein